LAGQVLELGHVDDGADLLLGVVLDLAELTHGPTQLAGELGELLGTDHDESHQQDDDELRGPDPEHADDATTRPAATRPRALRTARLGVGRTSRRSRAAGGS